MKSDDPTPRIAARLKGERDARGWSLADLAQRSGVSKAMISKVERAEASPTAALLGRLSGAFEISLSRLVADPPSPSGRLRRADQAPAWIDPATGYERRQVSPPSDVPIELVHVRLPPGAEVPYPESAFVFLRQLVWVLSGRLTFVEGDIVHHLGAGDCLALGPPSPCRFRNETRRPCAYVVALTRKG